MNMAGFPTKSGLFYLFRQKNTEMFDTVVDGGLAIGSVPITIFNFKILLLVIIMQKLVKNYYFYMLPNSHRVSVCLFTIPLFEEYQETGATEMALSNN